MAFFAIDVIGLVFDAAPPNWQLALVVHCIFAGALVLTAMFDLYEAWHPPAAQSTWPNVHATPFMPWWCYDHYYWPYLPLWGGGHSESWPDGGYAQTAPPNFLQTPLKDPVGADLPTRKSPNDARVATIDDAAQWEAVHRALGPASHRRRAGAGPEVPDTVEGGAGADRLVHTAACPPAAVEHKDFLASPLKNGGVAALLGMHKEQLEKDAKDNFDFPRDAKGGAGADRLVHTAACPPDACTKKEKTEKDAKDNFDFSSNAKGGAGADRLVHTAACPPDSNANKDFRKDEIHRLRLEKARLEALRPPLPERGKPPKPREQFHDEQDLIGAWMDFSELARY